MKISEEKGRLIVESAVLVLIYVVLFFSNGLKNDLDVRHYEIESDKITHEVTLALISDLHSCDYGERQVSLLAATVFEEPDLVMLAGDIFDSELSDYNAETFIKEITERDRCFYVTGDSEYANGVDAFNERMSMLEKYGVTRLSGDAQSVTINGQTINICGVDDPDASLLDNATSFENQLEQVKKTANDGNFTVLLSHRPEYFADYAQKGFDLVLSGHANGGQWCLPPFINGFYAPNQGVLPRYTGGRLYVRDDTTMIVSRGLAKENLSVPRFFNQPEVVIIKLVKKQ